MAFSTICVISAWHLPKVFGRKSAIRARSGASTSEKQGPRAEGQGTRDKGQGEGKGQGTEGQRAMKQRGNEATRQRKERKKNGTREVSIGKKAATISILSVPQIMYLDFFCVAQFVTIRMNLSGS